MTGTILGWTFTLVRGERTSQAEARVSRLYPTAIECQNRLRYRLEDAYADGTPWDNDDAVCRPVYDTQKEINNA